MVYDIETRSRENVGKVQRASDPSQCKITEYASNDWTYDFRGWWTIGWERPLLRVTRTDGIIRVIVVEHKGPFHCDIHFNGAKILDAVGGLERRHIGTMLGFDVEAGKPAPVQEMVTKSYVSSDSKKYLTYYGVKGSSFGVVSEHHMEELPKVGWNVHFVLMSDMLTRGVGMRDPVGIIHPVFYVFQNNYAHINRLKTFHRKVCGFDLADTDAIHHNAVNMANHMNLLMVPSECSRQTYINSGVKTRVEVVPHGVGPLFSSPDTMPLHLVPKDGVKVLFFFLHSHERKGHDIVHSAMSRLLKERGDVRLIVKGGDPVVNDPRTTNIDQWMWEGDLVHLYDACDILFAPSRGGGFELNVLEAMARGLAVVTSDWPAIKEFAEGALFIKSRGKVKPLIDNPIHTGYGVDPDPGDAYEKLKYAVENVESLKREAAKRAPAVRERWSWSNSAKKIAQCLEAL